MGKIKNLFKEVNKRVNIKKFYLAFLGVFIAYQFFPVVAYAAEAPGIVEKGLSALLRAFAWAIQETIIKPSGRPIQTLVFNQGVTAAAGNGIQLLSGNGLSNYMISMYTVIQWLASILFVPMGLVIAIDFKRSSDNAQHKAVLKDRLVKLCLTFVLLTSMPILLDIIFQFNNVLVDVFNSIGANKIKEASGFMNETEGTMLMDAFRVTAQKNKTLLDGALYLMATTLNLWMMFYYMVRDLTIGFMFMLFPIVAVFYTFNKSMVTTWFKEMSSNILTQAIHAGVLCLVIGMASSFGKEPNLYQQLFVMVAFASIIPITATVKRLIGLEGSIGGASSIAGMGAAMGAMALAGGVMKSAKSAVGNVVGGARELSSLKSEKEATMKGADVEVSSTSSVDKELSPVNKSSGSLEDIKARQNTARKKILQGVTGGGAAALGSAVMGIAGAGLGGKTAMAGAAGGFIVGEKVGSAGGGVAYDVGASAVHDIADGAFGVGNRPDTVSLTEGNKEILNGDFTKSLARGDLKGSASAIVNSAKTVGSNLKNMAGNASDNAMAIKASYDTEGMRTEEDRESMANSYAGLSNEVMDGTDFQSQERRAKIEQKKYMSLGQPEKAFKAYARHTPKRATPEELQTISGNPEENGDLMMYRDKDMSAAYTEKQVEVEPGKFETQREVHWSGKGDPSLVTPSVSPLTFNNGSSDLPPELIKQITVEAENMALSVVKNGNDKGASESDKMAFNQVKNGYYQKEVKNQQDRIVKVRVELGSNNAYIPVRPANHVPIPSSVQNQVQQSVGTIEGLAEQKQALVQEMSSFNNSVGQIQLDTSNLSGLYQQLNN